MAERRMFSKKIIDSDLFIDMPTSSRLLYFDLCMRADDDGFVDSPQKIIRMTGASIDDLKLLILKNFVFNFDSGVIVISHWKVHNSIAKDRYKETLYLEEKNQLSLKENKAYTKNPVSNMYTECIQPVNILDTQDRLDKDRLDKDRLDKDRLNRDTYQQIVDMYNETCVSYPKCIKLSDARIKAIKARLKKFSVDDFKVLFNKAQNSDYLKGANKYNWCASFDWLIADKNFVKVIEGKYDDFATKKGDFGNGENSENSKQIGIIL